MITFPFFVQFSCLLELIIALVFYLFGFCYHFFSLNALADMSNTSQCYFSDAQGLQKSMISVFSPLCPMAPILLHFRLSVLQSCCKAIVLEFFSRLHFCIGSWNRRFLVYNIILYFWGIFCVFFFFFAHPELSNLPIFEAFPML